MMYVFKVCGGKAHILGLDWGYPHAASMAPQHQDMAGPTPSSSARAHGLTHD